MNYFNSLFVCLQPGLFNIETNDTRNICTKCACIRDIYIRVAFIEDTSVKEAYVKGTSAKSIYIISTCIETSYARGGNLIF